MFRRRQQPVAAVPAAGAVERVSDLVNALPTGVVVLDRAEEIVLANPAAHSLGLLVDDGLNARLRTLIRTARRESTPTYADIVIGEPPNERSLHVQATRSSRGEITVLADDFTDAVRVEAVRRDFVANVSHELKTPVGAVSLLAETIVEARDDPAAVAQFAGRLQIEAQRLSRLVDDLIQLSRVQGGVTAHREPVALGGVIGEAIDRNRVAAERKSIALSCPADVTATVSGDARQLCTALSNVVENAIAYSPEAGHVGIGVEKYVQHVDVVVTDNGIGIPAHEIARIFERFYRIDPARSRATGGTGLGLSIAKHVITNHGGAIRVWSEEGKGSTFTIRLPLADEDAA